MNMKLDTSGLESFVPLHGGSDDLCGSFSSVPSFELPKTANFDDFQKKAVQMVKLAKGTTTHAFIFKEGLMVAADISRASMGRYISGDSSPEELVTATQVQGAYLPIVREMPSVELVKANDEMKSFNAYSKLRLERTNKRHHGARMKKAAEAVKDEKK